MFLFSVMLSCISCVFPLGSGLVPFWESVHVGNVSPFSRDGVRSFFIGVEVCIKMGCSASYSATHISVCDYSVLLQF